jgi:AraC-like DNA-binding protein
MEHTGIKYKILGNKKLYVEDLTDFLREDKSDAHLIKGTLVCFCRKGDCVVKINFTSHSVKQDDVFVILPTHMFSIEHQSDDFKAEALLYTDDYWMTVSESINYNILKKVEFHPAVSLPKENQDETYPLLRIIKEHEKGDVNAIERSIVSSLAYSLLLILMVMVDKDTDMPPTVSRKEELTRDFFQLLSEHFETERQASFYASKLCVTPKHLSMCVSEVTKLSILEWINTVTVLNIKRRLRTTNDTIQQISEDFNFQTASTFIRYFRQHTGTTPLKFRNSD